MPSGARRLLAIMFSDIVGYTAAMGRDEERAIRAVSESRNVQRQLVEKFNGLWIQTVGDGVLCAFESAVEAATCAQEIQRAFHGSPDLRLRIGIHEGDLVVRETEGELEIFGDAVNIAARIQAIAEPGAICVTERVCDDLANHPGFNFEPLGEKRLKNVNRPIRVYHIVDAEPSDRRWWFRLTPATRHRMVAAMGAAASLAAVAGLAMLWIDRSDVTRSAGLVPAPDESAQAFGDESAGSVVEERPTLNLELSEASRATGREASLDRSDTKSGYSTSTGSAAVTDPIPPGHSNEEQSESESAPPQVQQAGGTVASAEEAESQGDRPPLDEEGTSRVEGRVPAVAAPPPGARAAVQNTIDEILKVLREPALAPEARLRWIEHIAYARFDFETFSRLTLRNHWLRFSKRQREELIREFEVHLAHRYSSKIEAYKGEDIKVTKTFPHHRGDVTVTTAIIGGSGSTLVDYRMRQENDAWRVIDVTIDGVSLMLNFRDQFASVLQDGSPQDLLNDVRRKNAAALARKGKSRTKVDLAFDSTRTMLLEGSGPWREAKARVWAEPNPVKYNEAYQVHFEAQCDCDAVLLAVHGLRSAITLLYPGPNETNTRLAPGQERHVSALPPPQISGVGGYGMDVLKLFVSRRPLNFTAEEGLSWTATPSDSRRVDQLRTFVESLEGDWDSAVAYVEITR